MEGKDSKKDKKEDKKGKVKSLIADLPDLQR